MTTKLHSQCETNAAFLQNGGSDSEVGITLKKPDKNRMLGWLAVLLSTLTLAMVLALGIVVFNFSDKVQRELFTAQQSTLDVVTPYACIPCSKLLRDPADVVESDPLLQQLEITDKDGTDVCCAYSPLQVTALFESIVRLNDPPNLSLASFNASDFTFSPVSAHKRLYADHFSQDLGVIDFPQRSQICELKEDDDRYYGLEHHRGVNLTKHGLKIVHGGLYYVYSSIKFRPHTSAPCREFEYQTFNAFVEKVSLRRRGSQNILQFSHTCCDDCMKIQETGYTGGVFVLDPGDVVRVRVTGFRLVHFEAETSFMGLAMLGSPSENNINKIKDLKLQ
ncbi:hypothetical protein EGW08_017216 [Elysia chlorotica]|uniref:THD domain-containing protein n=1 Tax=Elysia chlorotica TaxID=188477 RepID=A0A3S1B390_ELYCH|nr:hypothetical protein EGW08_017216 [Elysia chlorotica]